MSKTSLERPAPAEEPIHDLLKRRWSPRSFDPSPIAAGTLRVLFEAARWAASSNNEQPWRYVVAQTPEALEKAASVLTPKNRQWAARAPVLVCVAASLFFHRGGKPNRHAYYDTGQATAQLALQAAAMGLAVHQMAGFDVESARSVFGIPDGCDPVAMMAIGFPADPSVLPEDLREREMEPRIRRRQDEFVFLGAWGGPWPRPVQGGL